MDEAFRPGRVGIAVLTAALCAVYGAPLMRDARLERRAERLRVALVRELGPLDAPARPAPPWQERWERATAELADWLERTPERPPLDAIGAGGAGAEGGEGADEHLLRWAHELREAHPELEAVLRELARLEPAAIPPLTRPAKLLPVREWQNAVLVEARDAAAHAEPERALAGLGDALRLARAADSGTAFGGMLRMALEHAALDAALEVVERGTLEPEALASLLRAHLADAGARDEGWRERIRSELGAALALLEHAPDAGRRASLATWVELAEDGLEAATWDPGATGAGPPASRGNSGNAPNAWGIYLVSSRMHEARRNAALTALALVAEHHRAGRWPTRLDGLPDLLETDTLDPATGQPLPWHVEPADPASEEDHASTGPQTERLVVGPSELSEHACVTLALAP